MQLDVSKNRNTPKWTLGEQIKRILWVSASPLFWLSPRPFWGWRRTLLRTFGASVGADAHIYPSVRITMPWNLALGCQSAIGDRVIVYALGPITIGARSTVSQGAHLCAGTHDIVDPARPLLKLPIHIGEDVWICADAFVGPGVTIHDRAIVGARAVAMKDVQVGEIIVGNPARSIRRLQ